MKMQKNVTELSTILLLLTMLLLPARSYAHCDTLDGPVVQTARAALEKGDVTPLLKWVRAEDESVIRQAFQQTMTVRAQGPEAKELADRYLFETLVRIHRAGEGVSYTGLKAGDAVDPAVALADKALASGSVDTLVEVLTKAMAEGIRERFAHARETSQHADDSVLSGRQYVAAYVLFTHYVEGLHGLITGGAGHHDAAGKKGAAPHHHQ